MLAVDLTGRIIRAHGKAGRKKEAADLSESVAALVEASFDWDSLMSADAWREVFDNKSYCCYVIFSDL